MDKLTKLTYFILVKDNTKPDNQGYVYVREIVKLYGMPKQIVFKKRHKICLSILATFVEFYRYNIDIQYYL